MLNVGDVAYTTADKHIGGAYPVTIIYHVFDPDTKELTHYVFKVYTCVDDYISMRPIKEVFSTADEAEKAVDDFVAKQREFKKKIAAIASELQKRTKSA